MLFRSLDRNFDEERSSEAEKRHQQLLKKLDMLMGNGTATKTAEPSGDTGGGLLDSISDILMGILESRFGNLLKLAGSRFLGGLLASGPLLALGTLGAIAYFIVNAASEEANRQTAEGVSRAMDVSTEGAAIVEAADVDIVEKRKQRLLAEIGRAHV